VRFRYSRSIRTWHDATLHPPEPATLGRGNLRLLDADKKNRGGEWRSRWGGLPVADFTALIDGERGKVESTRFALPVRVANLPVSWLSCFSGRCSSPWQPLGTRRAGQNSNVLVGRPHDFFDLRAVEF
jgi:hypothetical protein